MARQDGEGTATGVEQDPRAELAGPAGGERVRMAPPAAISGPVDVPGTAAEDDERRRAVAQSDLEVCWYALKRRRVTFHDVATAWFHMSDQDLHPEERRLFRAIFPGLLDAFADPRGGIITAYFCRNIRVAAVLTDIETAATLPEGVPTAERSPFRSSSLQRIEELFAAREDGAGDAMPAVAAAAQAREHAPDRPPRRRRLGRRGRADGGEEEAGDRRERRDAASRTPHDIVHPFAHRAASSAIHIEPTFGDPADWKAKELLFRCLHLHYRALELLTPQPRKICMRLVFGVITALLGTLDSRRAPGRPAESFPRDAEELSTLQRELDEAEAYFARSAQRQAQLEYFLGMLLSAVLLAGLFVVLSLGGDPLGKPLLVSLFAGAAGAVVSVMTRMTRGDLVLKPEAGKWAIRIMGTFRPVIGAVFGAVLYAMLEGGLVALAGPSGDAPLYFAALGFLAGFSERFAQDAIAGASGAQALTGAASVAAEAPRGPRGATDAGEAVHAARPAGG